MPSQQMHVDCPQCLAENLRGYSVCWKCGYPLARTEHRRLSAEELEELLAQGETINPADTPKPENQPKNAPQPPWWRRWRRR